LLDRTAETTSQRAETQRPDELPPRARRNPFASLPRRIARTYHESGLRGIGGHGFGSSGVPQFSLLLIWLPEAGPLLPA